MTLPQGNLSSKNFLKTTISLSIILSFAGCSKIKYKDVSFDPPLKLLGWSTYSTKYFTHPLVHENEQGFAGEAVKFRNLGIDVSKANDGLLVRLKLYGKDIGVLRNFSNQNVGSTILIFHGDKLVTSGYLSQPLSRGDLEMEVSKARSDANFFKLLESYLSEK